MLNHMLFIWINLLCFSKQKDGSLPFARSIKDVHSEFRLLSKLTELLMKQKQYEEALQYATLAVQVSATTGKTFILS